MKREVASGVQWTVEAAFGGTRRERNAGKAEK